MKMLVASIYWRYRTEVVHDGRAAAFGPLEHKYVVIDQGNVRADMGLFSHWNHRKTFRDVLPFRGVNGVVAFTPYVGQEEGAER